MDFSPANPAFAHRAPCQCIMCSNTPKLYRKTQKTIYFWKLHILINPTWVKSPFYTKVPSRKAFLKLVVFMIFQKIA
ncbi:hypothetical protein XENTR_v10013911 [Xenopus tropicalis]|nr:hypothetical protein XENTR_v10013911 [Xenopus tropicalis]